MKPLTICMFSNLFPPVVSGSSTQSFALSRELVARGHKVVMITAQTRGESRDRDLIEGITVIRLPSIKLPQMGIAFNFPWLSITFTPGNLRRIENVLTEFKPDLLHVHNHMFDLALSASLMRKRHHIPMVVTIHTMIKHANPFYNAFLYPADRLFLKHFVIKQADGIISPDVNMTAYIESAWGRQDSHLVPYGISLPSAPSNALVNELRVKYGLEGKRVVLSLGHIHDIRNRKDIVKAFPGVLAKIPNAVLVLVGSEGTDLPRRLAKELGIEKSVVFTGAAPHHEVPAFLSMADIETHWANQDDPEKTSLGIASLEALLSGKTILAAANPDTYGKGILQDGVNFVLARPGQPAELAAKVIQLLENEELRNTIGQRALKTVTDHFLWESVCNQTLSVYEQVCANGKPAAPAIRQLI